MNIFVRTTSRFTQDRDLISLVNDLAAYINHGKHHYVCHKFASNGLAGTFAKKVYTPVISGANLTHIDRSDVLVFLPGGFGTISSLSYSIKTKLEFKHKLPIIIVNINGFYDPLLEQFKNIRSQKFFSQGYDKHHLLYKVANSSEELISILEEVNNSLSDMK